MDEGGCAQVSVDLCFFCLYAGEVSSEQYAAAEAAATEWQTQVEANAALLLQHRLRLQLCDYIQFLLLVLLHSHCRALQVPVVVDSVRALLPSGWFVDVLSGSCCEVQHLQVLVTAVHQSRLDLCHVHANERPSVIADTVVCQDCG